MQYAQHFDAIRKDHEVDDVAEKFQPHGTHVLLNGSVHLGHSLDPFENLA